MYLLTLVAKTTEENPDHGSIGEAYINCWVNTDDEAEATKLAYKVVAEDDWQIIETKEVSVVTAETYEDDAH